MKTEKYCFWMRTVFVTVMLAVLCIHPAKAVKPVNSQSTGISFFPPSSSFDSAPGTISGTPTVSTPAKNYIVTACNGGRSVQTKVNIGIINPHVQLSYASPNTYKVGMPISPLVPVSANVSAAGYPSAPNASYPLGGSIWGVALDAAGNIYAADNQNGRVLKMSPNGTNVVSIGPQFPGARAVAVDAAGNVYVITEESHYVLKLAAGASTATPIGNYNVTPRNLAVDAAGNVYVTDTDGGGYITKILPDGVNYSTVTTVNQPGGIALDGYGNIYVSSADGIQKIPAGKHTAMLISSTPIAYPFGLAVDATGNVFYTDLPSNLVTEIPASGPVTSIPFSGVGVAVNNTGKLFVTDAGSNINVFTPVGGYFINAQLPAGLNFSSATAVISGTPTAVSTAKNYQVTAYNSFGSAQATVNIAVEAVPVKVSYTSPQNFTVGTTIAPLVPVSSGVAAPALGTPVILAPGPTWYGITIDVAGNLYATDVSNNRVVKMLPDGTNMVDVAYGFAEPFGITVDAKGNVYVADYGDFTIKKVPAGGGAPVVLAQTTDGYPKCVAVDAKGDVYFAGDNYLDEILADGITVVKISNFQGQTLNAMTIDGLGYIYTVTSDGTILKTDLASLTSDIIGTGFTSANAIAVDGAGNVYLADNSNNTMTEIPVNGSANITVNLNDTYGYNGITVNNLGKVYITDTNTNLINANTPVGGYTISPALPAGLNFNSANGVISGTPTATSSAKNYTVRGYNLTGYATVAVNIAVAAPPISLSYAGPKSYAVATASSPLIPTSAGVSPVGYDASASYFLGVTPGGVALDATGNVYVTDVSNNQLLKMAADGTHLVALASGFNSIYNIAVDAAGNVYGASYTDHSIIKLNAGASTPIAIGTGIVGPVSLTADAAGNVYVSDQDGNAIKKIAADGITTTTIASINKPGVIAIDAAGNIYVGSNSNIWEIPAGQTAPVLINSSFSQAIGIAVDASGNFYVADAKRNRITVLPAGGGTPANIALNSAGKGQTTALAINSAGKLFVANSALQVVSVYTPTGGYFLNTPLPNGLSFDSNTGTISGIPTKLTAAKDYKVTAYNIAASLQAIVNIKVVTPGAAPTIQASKVQFANTSAGNTTVSWTNGNGTSRAVFIAMRADGGAIPDYATTYTANTNFGSGTQIGNTGWYCIYNGAGTTTNVSGLQAGTNYRVTVVEYNGTTGTQSYLTTRLSPATVQTLNIYPTIPSLQVKFTDITTTSTSVNWISGNGTARAVFIAQRVDGNALPVDGVAYTGKTTFGMGTQVGTTGWYCIYNGTGSSANVTGLSVGTTYRVTVVEYNTVAGVQKYQNNALNPASVTTLRIYPLVPALQVNFTNTTTASTTANWTSGDGTARAVFGAKTNNGSALPVDGTTYAANARFGAGQQIGSTGWYCIYNGTGSSADIAALTANTTYRVTVVEYLGNPGSEKYLVTSLNTANVTTGLQSNNSLYKPGAEATLLVATLNSPKVEANNLLSPNGDGVNDIWVVKNIGFYPNNIVTVYDRAGKVVFAQKGYTNNWDGSYRGSVLNEGTYYYNIDLGNGTKLSGFITVVRDR